MDTQRVVPALPETTGQRCHHCTPVRRRNGIEHIGGVVLEIIIAGVTQHLHRRPLLHHREGLFGMSYKM